LEKICKQTLIFLAIFLALDDLQTMGFLVLVDTRTRPDPISTIGPIQMKRRFQGNMSHRQTNVLTTTLKPE